MGEVYRACDEKLQRDVAIKMLPTDGTADEAAGARLLREARAAAALNHPNVCTIHEVGEHDGRTFIAMELVEGTPLDRMVPSGTGLSLDLVLAYGSLIADALAHVRSDLWALGVVLYELCAGRRPFGGQTPYELSSSILHDPPQPLPEAVLLNLQAIIQRCLEKDPDRRFQSAGEVHAAIDTLRATPVSPTIQRRGITVKTVSVATAAALLVGSMASVALNLGGVRDRFWRAQPTFDSIAVLPFDATGDAGQEYLASGIHRALITELAQLPGFKKVIARASTLRFSNSDQSPAEIARALGVRALVTGSLRRTGNRVQVSAQLVDGVAERQLWRETYDREAIDVIAVQNDIVTAVAQAVELQLRPSDREKLAARARISPEPYELYLRGMHELDREGDQVTALKYLQAAIDRDPGDPHAYVGLAKGHARLGHSPDAPDDAWIRARAAAERALTLSPDLPDGHAVLADVKLYYERDGQGAERAFERANQLNSNVAMNYCAAGISIR